MATCSISWSGHWRYVERSRLDGHVFSRAHYTGGVHWMMSTSSGKFLFVLRLIFFLVPAGPKRSDFDFDSACFNPITSLSYMMI